MRVEERKKQGGHGVEAEKVFSRYIKSMKLMPEVIKISDYARVYDNSSFSPVLIFEKDEDGQSLLLNREIRGFCTDFYITEPLQKLGISILQDLSCEETKEFKNSF